MELLPNEQKIVQSNDTKVILTNYRIHMNDSTWGQSYFINIFLEDVSTIEVKYKSNIWLLVVAAFLIFIGVYLRGTVSSFGIIAGVLFLVLWWFGRKHVVSISSNGGSVLNFIVQGMGDDEIEGFIQKVFLAKHTRVNELYINKNEVI